MGYGNSKSILWILIFLCIGNIKLSAQQTTKTSKFLYNQLDYFLQNPSESKLHRLHKLTASKEKQLRTNEDKLAWVIIHSNMGYYQHQFGNIPTAIIYYEKAWKTYSNNALRDYDIIENCLQPLGNLYLKIGDLEKAENTITNYLYLAEQSKKKQKIISALTHLSIAHNNKSNYIKAIEILNKGKEIAPKNVNILTNLATNYLHLGAKEKATEYASSVISIDPNQVNAYQILAEISLDQNDIINAKKYALQAKEKLLQEPNSTARDLAKWQLGYTDIFISKSDYAEALQGIKEIYSYLLPEYTIEMDFPKTEILIADKILLKALDVHSYIYQQLNKLHDAIKIYETAFEVNLKLETAYPLQETKIIQHSQNRNRTEEYIQLLYSLYLETEDIQYVVKAFEAAETSKAPFVNEALISKQLLSRYKNDSLIVRKNQLTYELSNYDTYILKEKQKGNAATIPNSQEWTSTYSKLSIELKEVNKNLQEKYPILLSDNKKISVKKLQKKLKKDDLTLIEYFFGEQSIYQFIIDGTTIRIQKITNPENFRKTVLDYIDYFNNASAITNNSIGFSQSSFNLYQALHIPDTGNKLIIPDGLLNFVPFETLLTKKSNALNFQKMPFLLKYGIITYEISANKYLRSKNKNNSKSSILGIFPVFENTTRALPFSLEEKYSIEEKFEGLFLEKNEASYTRFLEEAEKHTILHLSTHAEAGSFSRPASIQFSDQNILVNQLYGLQLTAQLIVLSACETGIGTLSKGEGPLSIGRGFQYTGIQNTLFSLWNVNDKTTAQFMKLFYENLDISESNSYATHAAKLDYLNSQNISNAQKSPYYWAAFVYYGSYQTPNTSSYNWMLITGVFLLIILFLLGIRQKLT